jgi:hypothetical protein
MIMYTIVVFKNVLFRFQSLTIDYGINYFQSKFDMDTTAAL